MTIQQILGSLLLVLSLLINIRTAQWVNSETTRTTDEWHSTTTPAERENLYLRQKLEETEAALERALESLGSSNHHNNTSSTSNNNNNTLSNDSDRKRKRKRKRSNNSSATSTATPGNVCLTTECIEETAGELARAWRPRTNHSEWILSKHQMNKNYTTAGIICVKNFKAASTTAAGISMRVARRLGPRYNLTYYEDNDSNATSEKHPKKTHRAMSRSSHIAAYRNRGYDQQRTLLFSSVRDPAARAISRIFYTTITKREKQPTDKTIRVHLGTTHGQYGSVSHTGGGFQVRYLSLRGDQLPRSWSDKEPKTVKDPGEVVLAVREIIDTYDFLMVSERMEESIVAFYILFGLEPADVMVMDSKINKGGETNYLFFSPPAQCKKSVKSFRSPAIREYLESDAWRAQNYGDYLLAEAASRSLDRTIDAIGAERFRQERERYRSLREEVVARCAEEVIYHCSSNGTVQIDRSSKNCYADDSGCGYPCVDAFFDERNTESFSSSHQEEEK